MGKKYDGGQAFPGRGAGLLPHTGMSLRDYFAAQVLPWCLAEFGGNAEDQKQPTEAAYQIADAMIAARDNG